MVVVDVVECISLGKKVKVVEALFVYFASPG